MATKLPPLPVGVAPGSGYWNDWYEKLRTLVNNTVTGLPHNSLSGLQGGTAAQYYHLSLADYARVAAGFSYGDFCNTSTITAAAADTPYAITFSNTNVSLDVTLGSPTSRIVCGKAGIYSFEFSLQVESSSAATQTITIWARKNGTDIANSASTVSIKSNTETIVPAWNFVETMGVNDYFELVWSTTSTTVTLSAHASQTVPYIRPAIPSALLTAFKLGP